jgi:hypothetical protein
VSFDEVRNNLWDWQSLAPDVGPGAQFFDFCDALEVDKNGKIASASGFGLDHALDAWGTYFNATYLPLSMLSYSLVPPLYTNIVIVCGDLNRK